MLICLRPCVTNTKPDSIQKGSTYSVSKYVLQCEEEEPLFLCPFKLSTITARQSRSIAVAPSYCKCDLQIWQDFLHVLMRKLLEHWPWLQETHPGHLEQRKQNLATNPLDQTYVLQLYLESKSLQRLFTTTAISDWQKLQVFGQWSRMNASYLVQPLFLLHKVCQETRFSYKCHLGWITIVVS